MHAQLGPSQNSCWRHETFFPRSYTGVSLQDLEKMHSVAAAASWRAKVHLLHHHQQQKETGKDQLGLWSDRGLGVQGNCGWDWGEVAEVSQDDCGLCYTVATGASQGTAALHCTVGMTEASRGSWSFVLCCRSGAFCCPRAAAHQETLQCRVAISPGDVWFCFVFFCCPERQDAGQLKGPNPEWLRLGWINQWNSVNNSNAVNKWSGHSMSCFMVTLLNNGTSDTICSHKSRITCIINLVIPTPSPMHSIMNLAGACYDQGRICPEGIIGDLEINVHLVLGWRGASFQMNSTFKCKKERGRGTDSILRVAIMFKQQQFK